MSSETEARAVFETTGSILYESYPSKLRDDPVCMSPKPNLSTSAWGLYRTKMSPSWKEVVL